MTKKVGIIGGGLSALMVYAVLRFRGLDSQDIVVYSDTASPELSWQHAARFIHQQSMRSESDGHFFPTASPGLATIEACRNWSLKPLILSWFDQYRPSVETMLDHIRCIAQQTNFYVSLIQTYVGRIEKNDEEYTIYDSNNQLLGSVQHLILAVGHGPWRIPPVISDFQAAHPDSTNVFHSFAHDQRAFGAGTVVVLGDGLTAATEWVNLLQQGHDVTAIIPTEVTFGQPLSTPRRYFSKRGLAPYRQQPVESRLAELKTATKATVPTYQAWLHLLDQAEYKDRFRFITGKVEGIQADDSNHLQCQVRIPTEEMIELPNVAAVIAATGFKPAIQHPILAHLILEYSLPTFDRYLLLTDTFQIPILSTPHSTASVIGPAAAWALPCADSFGGMKIAAHTIADHILGQESWSPRELWQKTNQWWHLIRGRELV